MPLFTAPMRTSLPLLKVLVCLALCARLASAGTATISDTQASDYVGEYVTVVGRVASVYTSNKGNTFLNFGAAYPNQIFSGVIFASDADAFANVHSLQGRTVRITGVIRLYQGKPEIILNSASQLER